MTVEEEAQHGRITAADILVGRSPFGILTVLGAKPIRRKLSRAGVHDFGHGGSVDLIKALPEGAETLTFQMTNDDLSKVEFSSRQLLPGERTEFPEALRVHVRKRH